MIIDAVSYYLGSALGFVIFAAVVVAAGGLLWSAGWLVGIVVRLLSTRGATGGTKCEAKRAAPDADPSARAGLP